MKKNCLIYLLGMLCFWHSVLWGQELKAHKQILKLMGSKFEITAISEDQLLARQAIQIAIQEIQRIEQAISSWQSHSETSQINQQAGLQAVKVSPELFGLIKRSLKVSQLTQGAFDISFASMERIWSFQGDTLEVFPRHPQVQAARSQVNYQNIILNETDTTVFLKTQGMKIGFGAIGKGYAANRARALMQNLGIKHGLVNAGGDLISWGQQVDGQAWRVGIADPQNPQKVFAWLAIHNQAVVTSGNYEKYFIHQDKRYGHIINPKTGYPVTGLKSVTVLCPDAELADALATSVFVLGVEEGLGLINRLKNIECLIINDQDEVIRSKNLELNYYQKHDQPSTKKP